MSGQLRTLEVLPQDFRDQLEGAGVSPLWPMMRNVLPHDGPQPATKPGHWKYEALRPLLLRAGELTPVEKAERRVLVVNGPGRGKGAMHVTSSIYVGLQLLLPGEKAPVSIFGEAARFPVRRIFCVDRNYAAHAREMETHTDREPPFFFTKPVDAGVDAGRAHGRRAQQCLGRRQ